MEQCSINISRHLAAIKSFTTGRILNLFLFFQCQYIYDKFFVGITPTESEQQPHKERNDDIFFFR